VVDPAVTAIQFLVSVQHAVDIQKNQPHRVPFVVRGCFSVPVLPFFVIVVKRISTSRTMVYDSSTGLRPRVGTKDNLKLQVATFALRHAVAIVTIVNRRLLTLHGSILSFVVLLA
jgi:hypothetical protein